MSRGEFFTRPLFDFSYPNERSAYNVHRRTLTVRTGGQLGACNSLPPKRLKKKHILFVRKRFYQILRKARAHDRFCFQHSSSCEKTPYFVISFFRCLYRLKIFLPQNVPGARLIKLYSPRRYLPPLVGALGNDNGKNRGIKKVKKKNINKIAASEKIKGEKLGRPGLVVAR